MEHIKNNYYIHQKIEMALPKLIIKFTVKNNLNYNMNVMCTIKVINNFVSKLLSI